MKIGLTFLLALCFASGCSRPNFTDSSSLVADRTRGIPNVVELGMPFSEVKRATGDFIARRTLTSPANKGKPAYYLSGGNIPSLGIKVSAWGHEPARIGQISLVVSPKSSGSRFSGSLLCGLSFHNGQTVSRSQIIDVFGVPINQFHSPAHTNMMTCLFKGESVACLFSDLYTEFIRYPTQGISFNLKSNIVQQIDINWPVEQGCSSLPEAALRAPPGS